MKNRWKRLLSMLLATAMCLSLLAFPASAETTSGTCGENLTWTLDNRVLTISGTGEMTDYDYKSRAPWYSNSGKITSIVIEDGVTSIGSDAFNYCSKLTSITIPDSITSIGVTAFYGCSRLTSITIPDGVTSIGYSSFRGCSSLTSITIPDGVTSIGSSAFSDCTGLTNVTIPKGVTSIGGGAFSGCSKLTSITIPSSVTSIGENAFSDCTGLTNITIPEGVISINSSTFDGCTSLTSIAIPSSVISISIFAFWNCNNLADVYYGGSNWNNISIDSTNSWLTNAAIHYLNGGACGENLIWKLNNGVLTISGTGEMTDYENGSAPWYSDSESITSVVIEEGVTSIGAYAFSECYNLTKITIPNSVTTIGEGTFWDCSGLTGVTIPSDITSIGSYAFYCCAGLISVMIPEGVTSIAEGVFKDCSSLTSITIPESVTSIGNFAFWNCDNLADIYYGGSEKTWNAVSIGIVNEPLSNANIHFKGTEPVITRFDDVNIPTEYYYDPVYWAVEKGITTGATATTFEPLEACKRAQVVTFLWRTAGCPEPSTTVSPFTDVQNSSEYYYKAVMWAVEKGITTGATETTFEPESTCNWAQIVTFLWRYENKPAPTSTVNPFVDIISGEYYYNAVLWAAENKITTGTDDTHFSPDDPRLRAQIVTFLYRDMAK